MTFDEVILELYRLAETKTWEGTASDEAVATAIEALEQIWMLRQAEMRRGAKTSAQKRQQRLWV